MFYEFWDFKYKAKYKDLSILTQIMGEECELH